MATNTFKIELPDAGNTLSLVSDISTIYVTEIKEIIKIKSYNNWVNPNESQIQLWCPHQSSRKLEVMEIHDEDQEELSSASVTVGILWKDEMKWTGVCKSKMRISPACIADSDVFFVLIEVNPNVLDREAKTLLRTNAVRRWINSSYNALLQFKYNKVVKIFHSMSQSLDCLANQMFGPSTIPRIGPADRGQVARFLAYTHPTMAREHVNMILMTYTSRTVNKMCSIDHSCRLAVMLIMIMAWQYRLFRENYIEEEGEEVFEEKGFKYYWPSIPCQRF